MPRKISSPGEAYERLTNVVYQNEWPWASQPSPCQLASVLFDNLLDYVAVDDVREADEDSGGHVPTKVDQVACG